MKKNILIVLLALLAVCNNTMRSQSTICAVTNPEPGWFDKDWDWTIPTNTTDDPNRWIARVASGSTSTLLSISSPFANGGTNEVNDLVFNQDYKPEQGWVLLFKDFGYTDPSGLNSSDAKNDIPTFILYNKYRSLIRVFMYANGSPSFNYAYLNAVWQNPYVSTYNNSLLTMGRKNLLPNSEYPSNNNTDRIAVHINDYANHQWMVAEVVVHFDINTSEQNYGERILFDLKDGISSNIAMDANFFFSTKSAAAKDPPAATPNPNFVNQANDYINKAKEYLGKVPTRTELETNFNQMASASASLNSQFSSKFATSIAKVNNELQSGNLKKYLLGTADAVSYAGGALGLAGTLLKTFIGKADPALATNTQKYIEPTVSSGFLTLSGKITTTVTSRIIDFQLPGTLHKDAQGCTTYLGLPYYDCPLGVVAVQETPVLNKKVFRVPIQAGYLHSSIDFQVPAPLLGTNCDPSNQPGVTTLGDVTVANVLIARNLRKTANFQLMYDSINVYSYQINGKLKLVYNEAAGVEIVETKAALYFEIDAIPVAASAPTPAMVLQPYGNQPPRNFNNTNPAYNNIQIDANMFLRATNPNTLCTLTSMFSGLSFSNFQQDTVVTTNPRHYAVELLNKEVMDLATHNEDGFHSFQTPFVDLDKFDGTSITIQEGATPRIKIQVVMKPTDPDADQTPIVYTLTYEIPGSKINTINGGSNIVEYPMTCEQRINDNSSITKIPGVTTKNPGITQDLGIVLGDSTNNQVTANAFWGQVEFVANNYIKVRSRVSTPLSSYGSVRLHIAPSNACVAGGDAKQITGYFGSCNTNPLARMIRQDEGDSIKLPSSVLRQNTDMFENQVYLYPNPNNGSFTLYLSNEVSKARVIITNQLGLQVYRNELENLSKITLSLPELTKGIYFLTLITDAKIKPIKFVVE